MTTATSVVLVMAVMAIRAKMMTITPTVDRQHAGPDHLEQRGAAPRPACPTGTTSAALMATST